MTRTRVFYGHEGAIPPTGLRVRSGGAPAAPADLADAAPDAALVGAVEIPDRTWKVPQIDAFAVENGIDFPDGAKKPEKLAAVDEWVANLPTAEVIEATDPGELSELNDIQE